MKILPQALALASLSSALICQTHAATPVSPAGLQSIELGGIAAAYDASQETLKARGYASVLNYEDTNYPIFFGTFDLTASIANDGTFLGGHFTVDGSVEEIGLDSGRLLSGDLLSLLISVDEDSPADQLLFEFSSDDLSSDFSSLFSSAGRDGQLALRGTGFAGRFDQDWDNLIYPNLPIGEGDGEVLNVIPEPAHSATIAGLGVLLVLLGLRRRFSDKNVLISSIRNTFEG